MHGQSVDQAYWGEVEASSQKPPEGTPRPCGSVLREDRSLSTARVPAPHVYRPDPITGYACRRGRLGMPPTRSHEAV